MPEESLSLRKKKAVRYKQRMDKVLSEKHVAFSAPDRAIIKGTLCIPKADIIDKALLLHEIEGYRNGGLNNLQKIAHRYARKGIASLRIDFSGHGTRKDEWKRYGPLSMVSDARASIDYLDTQLPEIENTMVIGASTGGSIAVIIGDLDQRVHKRCLIYPVLSYKYNFIAAAMGHDLGVDIKDWNNLTPWRAQVFPKEALEACLNDDADINLYVHKYSARFIKECKKLVDENYDVNDALIMGRDIPTTILQGDGDPCVPHVYASVLSKECLSRGRQVKLVTMKDMFHWVNKNWRESVFHQFDKAALGSFKSGMLTIALRGNKFRYPDPNNQPQIPPKWRLNP